VLHAQVIWGFYHLHAAAHTNPFADCWCRLAHVYMLLQVLRASAETILDSGGHKCGNGTFVNTLARATQLCSDSWQW
jgi:hypothetical protein